MCWLSNYEGCTFADILPVLAVCELISPNGSAEWLQTSQSASEFQSKLLISLVYSVTFIASVAELRNCSLTGFNEIQSKSSLILDNNPANVGIQCSIGIAFDM